MKRIMSVIFIFIALGSAFTTTAHALDDTAQGYLEEFYRLFGTSEELSDRIGIEALLSELLSSLSGSGGAISSFCLYVLGAAMLVAMASLISDKRYVTSAVCALVTVGICERIYRLVLGAQEALSGMSDAFLSLVPIATGVTLAGGGANSAGAEAASMGLVFGVVSGILTPLVLPLICMMLALSVCSALGGAEVRLLFARVRSVFLWIFGIASSILMGGIALQGVISSAKDSAAMRLAKYSASGLLPVIGGTVSASLSSLAAGLSYAKSIIGAQAIYTLVALAIAPLVTMLLYRLILCVGGGLLSFFGEPLGACPFSYVCFSIDALLALYGVSVLLYVFEIVMFMKSGVAIL